MAKQVNCPLCGKLADANLDHCPHCGGPMRDALPGAKEETRTEASGESCPSCGNTVREGDIICVRCGTNLLTGQKIAVEQQEVVKRERNRQPLYIVSGVLAAALILAAGGAFILLQDPIKEARQLAAQGNTLEAIEALREFVSANPGRGDAQMLMGQLNWRVGRYLDAANAFDAAFNAAPDNAGAGRLAVLAAGRLASIDGGQRQLTALETLTERHPEDVDAQRLLGLALGASGDWTGQARVLGALTGRTPGDGAANQYLGVALALSGDTAGATEALTRAERLGASGAPSAQGHLAGLTGNDAVARRQLSAAAQVPGASNAHTQARLGMLALQDGDYEQALRAFDAAHSASGIEPVVMFFRALCLKELGLNSDALAAFEQLTIGDTDFAADAAVQTALIHMNAGELVRAEEALRRASQYGATSAQYHTAQGRLQGLNGQLPQAQQSVRKASSLDSQYPGAHLESGLLYIRRGVLADGITELERYIELAGPGNPRGRVHEIEMLAEQLRQSLTRPASTAIPSR